MSGRWNVTLKPEMRKRFGVDLNEVCRKAPESGSLAIPACVAHNLKGMAASYERTSDDVTCTYCLADRARPFDWLTTPPANQVQAYTLDVRTLDAVVTMPSGARILGVAAIVGTESVEVWALVNPDAALETRRFLVADSGDRIADVDRLTYVGTVQHGLSRRRCHVFEV